MGFERLYKCKICGEMIEEEWNPGAASAIPSTTTSGRRDHLNKHFFEEQELKKEVSND